MAKVNFGTLASDARGKINGIVYSKNKSGSYTRRKVTPANPNTPSQSLVRGSFATLARNWSAVLTDAQRAAWVSYANTYPRLDVFGASIKISGMNMYISLNQRLAQISKPLILVPPSTNVVTPYPFDPTSLIATASGSVLTVSVTAVAPPTTLLYIFAAKPLGAGRQPVTSDWRYTQVYQGGTGPFPVAADLHTAYVAKFGTWTVGQRISVLAASIDSASGLVTVGTVMTVISN